MLAPLGESNGDEIIVGEALGAGQDRTGDADLVMRE